MAITAFDILSLYGTKAQANFIKHMNDKIRKIKNNASEYLRKAIVFCSEDLRRRFTKGNKKL